MDIQTEVQKIHHQFGVSEKANYEIQKLFDKAIKEAVTEALRIHDVVLRSEQLNICKPPKFNDWLSDNFTRRTEYYYDKNSNNETYSIKEIESQYVMKFKTNI